MRLGGDEIYLLQYLTHTGSDFPQLSQSSDLWFQHIAIVVSDMDRAYKWIIDHGARPISESPQTIPEWNSAAAGIRAFYFRSPEGHPLELIYFPPGKGLPIWQNSKPLFLGIDHTAIAVSDTTKSLRLYQQVLGFVQAGGSLNYGKTQEALSAVASAKVQITSLIGKETRGMGLEFLHYLEGTKGRESRHLAHDLAASRMIIAVNHLEETLVKLEREDIDYFYLGEIKEEGSRKAALITDTDGHYLLLMEEGAVLNTP
jgi:catechol 2,3-dioxygenase-like lactoylglutathione lyase family enzyme